VWTAAPSSRHRSNPIAYDRRCGHAGGFLLGWPLSRPRPAPGELVPAGPGPSDRSSTTRARHRDKWAGGYLAIPTHGDASAGLPRREPLLTATFSRLAPYCERRRGTGGQPAGGPNVLSQAARPTRLRRLVDAFPGSASPSNSDYDDPGAIPRRFHMHMPNQAPAPGPRGGGQGQGNGLVGFARWQCLPRTDRPTPPVVLVEWTRCLWRGRTSLPREGTGPTSRAISTISRSSRGPTRPHDDAAEL